MPSKPTPPIEPTMLGAAELARRIADGRLSAVEAVETHVARIRQVNDRLNALVVPLLDRACVEAQAADEATRRGEPLGPLHGVPITIKECFHVKGTPATIGLTHRAGRLSTQDGVLVARLRRAGAIVLGKTNVPQLMILHETDSPVYGRANNPWNLERTPGGSTGGEAAVIAAGGSPLGLGSDLGGSIRIPSHFCGIQGIKPTSRRLSNWSAVRNFRGMEAIWPQPGPMAPRVEDLTLAMRVLCAEGPNEPTDVEVAPAAPPDPEGVHLSQLRVAVWTDDGYFPASPAIRRAVEEAAAALNAKGAVVESFDPPDVDEAMRLYFGLITADGGADLCRLLSGSCTDRRIRRMIRIERCPRLLRPALAGLLRATGQRTLAEVVAASGPRSADGYWRLVDRSARYVRRFMETLRQGGFDAMLCPPHALPAPMHGVADDLLPAASYALLPNLLGVPAGVVSATRVRASEEGDRTPSRDVVVRKARLVEEKSEGLPVGVQVLAPHWREDTVLAVMGALQSHFQQQADYPHQPPL